MDAGKARLEGRRGRGRRLGEDRKRWEHSVPRSSDDYWQLSIKPWPRLLPCINSASQQAQALTTIITPIFLPRQLRHTGEGWGRNRLHVLLSDRTEGSKVKSRALGAKDTSEDGGGNAGIRGLCGYFR